MTDLAPQLRAYVDGVADPVTAAEARRQAGEAPQQRGPRRSLVVVAAAAFLVLVVAAAVVAARLGSGGDGTSDVVAGRPSESVAPDDPSPADLAAGWERVGFAEAGLVADAAVYDIEYGHGVFVAVGARVEADGRSRAAAWASPDGRAWTAPARLVGTDGTPVAGFLKLVATSPDGFTALGGDETGWYSYRSPDGLTWERAAAGSEVLPGKPTAGAEFALAGTSDSGDLVAGDGGLVLLTSGFSVSVAGRAFEAVSPPREDADRDFKAIAPTDRGFLALGTAVVEGGLETVVWSSPDGLDWTRSGVIVGHEGIATTLAADGDTLLAAKEIASGDHAGEVWRSDDAGSTWEEQEGFAAEFPRSTIRRIVRAGEVWVAVGLTDTDDGEVADAWASLDGEAWVAMPAELRTAGRLRVAATDGDVVVAPGRTGFYRWSLGEREAPAGVTSTAPVPTTAEPGSTETVDGDVDESQVLLHCGGPAAIMADLDGDGRTDRAYHLMLDGSPRLGVCTGAGVLDEIEGHSRAELLFAADVQGDEADELFYGETVGYTDVFRLAALVDGELRPVRLADGEDLEVRAGRLEGSTEFRGFGCLDVEGSRLAELVQVAYGEATDADRVTWERTAFSVVGDQALIATTDRGDTTTPLDRVEAAARAPQCQRAATGAVPGPWTTIWQPYERFAPGDPARDTDDRLQDYAARLLEILLTTSTGPTHGAATLDDRGSIAIATLHLRDLPDDSVSGRDIRVYLRRGPNGWYVEDAEYRDVCARGVGTHGTLCL